MLPKPSFLEGSVGSLRPFLPQVSALHHLCGRYIGHRSMAISGKDKGGGHHSTGVDDEEMARAMGIDIRLVFSAVFVLASGLAGLTGVFGGPILGAFVGAEWEVLTLALVVVIIGGLGSILGAFVGSLAIGLLQVFTVVLLPAFSYFAVFAPMAITLAFRPYGFFGKK